MKHLAIHEVTLAKYPEGKPRQHSCSVQAALGELAQLSHKPGTRKRDQFLPGTEAVGLQNLVMPRCYLEQDM